MMRAATARAAVTAHRWPVATVSVLAATAVLTVLQFPFPQVRTARWRDQGALAAGQWWRLVTPLLVGFGLGALLLWWDRRPGSR